MNMLFPGTKQRPDLRPRPATPPTKVYPHLDLNLCANFCLPSNRHGGLGLFAQPEEEKKPVRKPVSLIDFANQLANT